MKRLRLILLTFFLTILLVACQQPIVRNRTTVLAGDIQLDRGPYDLTEIDALSLLDEHFINSTAIRIQGVGLGDTLETVITKFGKPAGMDAFPEFNALNLRYVNENNVTTVIFHFENENVQRIMIRPGFNSKLVNKSKVLYSKDDILKAFGKPDREEDNKYRLYVYYPEGLEIYHKRRQMVGYALVPPTAIPAPTIMNVTTRTPLENWGRSLNETESNESVEDV